jgi:hypothetical protein
VANPSPIVRITGLVTAAEERTVPGREAREARREDDRRTDDGVVIPGRYFPAEEARPAYDVYELQVLTMAGDKPGGYAALNIRSAELPGGVAPAVGSTFDCYATAYSQRRNIRGSRFNQIVYYFSAAVAVSSTGSSTAVSSKAA